MAYLANPLWYTRCDGVPLNATNNGAASGVYPPPDTHMKTSSDGNEAYWTDASFESCEEYCDSFPGCVGFEWEVSEDTCLLFHDIVRKPIFESMEHFKDRHCYEKVLVEETTEAMWVNFTYTNASEYGGLEIDGFLHAEGDRFLNLTFALREGGPSNVCLCPNFMLGKLRCLRAYVRGV